MTQNQMQLLAECMTNIRAEIQKMQQAGMLMALPGDKAAAYTMLNRTTRELTPRQTYTLGDGT
jgi:hypothetical protein